MASRLTIAQTHRAEADKNLQELLSKAKTLSAVDSGATAEELDAHVAAVEKARTAVAEADKEVVTAKALVDMEREAAAVTTVRNPATVTPRVEEDPKWGFASVGEFARAQRDHQLSLRMGTRTELSDRMGVVLAATERFRAQEIAELGPLAAAPSPLHRETQSEDGLMVPPEFRQQIWTPAYEADDLLPLFSPETTSSLVVNLLADETTPWGASGIKAYWVAEAGQLTATRLSTKPRQVQLHKAGCMVFATDELLQDTALLTARINQKAPQAIGWLISESLIRGNGLAKPLGYEDPAYGGVVSQAKETNQKAATIYAENVLNMASRTLEGPGSRIMWLGHRSIIPQLATLKIGVEPSWTNQNQGLREAPNGMLLGFQVRFSQHCQTLGTQGDLSLIDFSGYAAFVHSSGTRFDSSIHLYFDFDLSAFRWIIRVGGMPYLSTPVSPYKGSATMSHFVQLATRS